MRLSPRSALLTALVSTGLIAGAACAAEPDAAMKPEIQRDAATPQAVGARHTLRQIPEACARMEGTFTGQAEKPYDFSLVRTSANCQPRARFVDAAKLKPSLADGWKLNDLIRVPNAGCPSQQAVVKVWRKPANATPPKLDAQGRSRLYLQEMKDKAAAGKLNPIPLYAAELAIEGQGCG